jgi:hypothetical protein
MPSELPAVLTAWLRRAIRHPLQPRLLLSGSSLIAALCQQARIPNDIDYVVTGDFDAELIIQTAYEIVSLHDTSDPLEIVRTERIYEYTELFPGLRAHVMDTSGVADPQSFLVDFAFGDPLSLPPRVIDIAQVGSILAVAPESLFAWKVHALVQFGPYRWRPKDVYDLYVLWTEGQLNTRVLPEAIDLAFSSRYTTLDELDEFRTDDDWGLGTDGRMQWAAFAATYNVTLDFQTIRTELRLVFDSLF